MNVDLPPDRPQIALELKDGSQAVLSPITIDDRSLIESGFGHLSIESRYTRFGQGRDSLSDGELNYLADVDQYQHVALGAVIGGEAAGVGRYIRTPGTAIAEVAVTVLDEFQGRGLGKLLVTSLIAIARVDGVKELRFEVIPENSAVQQMIGQMNATTEIVDGLYEGRVDVDSLPVGPNEAAIARIVSQVRSEG